MAAAEGICCANCDCTKNIMKRCTGCLQAFYCSCECQRNHWPSHKPECIKARVLYPSTNKFLPAEKQGSGKVKTDSYKKRVSYSDNLASTKSYDSIATEEIDRQCRNNTSKCDSHNGDKTLTATDEEISRETDQLEKLSSLKCSLAAQEQEVADGLCKDKTEPTGSSSLYEDGSINAQEVIPISSSVTIFIKHNKAKHSLSIPTQCVNNGKSVLQCVSDLLHIPVLKLKLIHRGKMITPDNIDCFISEKALFQAFGEVAETEDDLEKSDIDLIMKQVGVERNTAIKALRNAGTVIDAIIDLGNK